MQYWEKQVILITGASRGIGRDIAIRLSSLGAKVAINYCSNDEKAAEVLSLCNKDKTKLYKADVSDETQVETMIDKIESDLGPISVLINNAGITKDGFLMTMSTLDWKAVLETSLYGAFYCSRSAVKHMIPERNGRIINISSISGIKGTAGQTNYSAAKAGLIGFTKALAREVGKWKITCNAVALGLIETDMSSVVPPEIIKGYKDSTALKQLGSTQNVSDLIEFIASDKAEYMTGQVLTLDGGII